MSHGDAHRSRNLDLENPRYDASLSPLQRSRRALEIFKYQLEQLTVASGHDPRAWVWHATEEWPSVPLLRTVPDLFRAPPLPRFVSPAERGVTLPPLSVEKESQRVAAALKRVGHRRLSEIFAACYPYSLTTTTKFLDDGTAYVVTGDIDAMWIRDSRLVACSVFLSSPLVSCPPPPLSSSPPVNVPLSLFLPFPFSICI